MALMFFLVTMQYLWTHRLLHSVRRIIRTISSRNLYTSIWCRAPVCPLRSPTAKTSTSRTPMSFPKIRLRTCFIFLMNHSLLYAAYLILCEARNQSSHFHDLHYHVLSSIPSRMHRRAARIHSCAPEKLIHTHLWSREHSLLWISEKVCRLLWSIRH